MRAPFNKISFVLSAFFFLVFTPPIYAQHGWPIEPTDSDHPLGTSFGEFQNWGGVFQHTGVDILATPGSNSSSEDPNAPWVVATVGGTLTKCDHDGNSDDLIIIEANGVKYSYAHFGYLDPTFSEICDNVNYGHVDANSRIAQLKHFLDIQCDNYLFNHLHYDVSYGCNYVNPLADITPNPDPEAPQIGGIFFAEDNSSPWKELKSHGPGGCAVVSGPVDIIAQIRDRDNAESTHIGTKTLWVRNVRWRACPDDDPNCSWLSTFEFNTMPENWGHAGNAYSSAYFSISETSTGATWISDSDYCKETSLYAVVTNFVVGNLNPNAAGNWNTNAISDGKYNVSIEATDFAGNVTVATQRACVQNTRACTTNLTIRDAADDYGAIPYVGSNWWLSPDITANPGTPNENLNIVLGSANPIDVRVWNYGSCPIPAGTTYKVCLGWVLPSGTGPYPLPPCQVIGCKPETVPDDAGLLVGASRTTSFSWTPSSVDVPNGHHCLIAWVNSTGDPAMNTLAVNWDDNRAQRNIEFVVPPGPGAPAFGGFWFNPQGKMSNRSVELKLRHSGPKTTIREVRLHVPPGVIVDRVVGGSIMGGYTGKKPSDPCRQKGRCKYASMSWQDAMKKGCTLVIGGIDPSGRVLLEGVKASKPQRIVIEMRFESNIKEGQFTEVDIVEYGILPGHKEVSPIGGMTINFKHK